MYICPSCNAEFSTEDAIVKHYLKCWKDRNPCHKSKPAPRSEDINTRTINNDMAVFFSSFQKDGSKNGRG